MTAVKNVRIAIRLISPENKAVKFSAMYHLVELGDLGL